MREKYNLCATAHHSVIYFDILLNYFQFKMHINAEDFGVDMPHVTNYWFKPLHGVD